MENSRIITFIKDNEKDEIERLKWLIGKIDINLQNRSCHPVDKYIGGALSLLPPLQASAISNLKSGMGWNLLMHETAKGYAQAVTFLLDAKAKVNLTDDMDWTALMIAACEGHAEIAEILVIAKSHINAKAHNGETALIFTALFGHAEVAAVLLKDRENMDKADVNATRIDGQTSLIIAVTQKQSEVIKILLGANADINIKDNDGKTALDYATPEVAHLLKQ